MLKEGPLVVSALGVDPPERSVHFHLSLLTTNGDKATLPKFKPTEDEVKELLGHASRLNTVKLTTVKGFDFTHGLVWEEGSIDLQTADPNEGLNLRADKPIGDGEPMLRRYIDDSINLLSGLELNRRREDEGQEPLNLLWPWGQGLRSRVPSLLLKYGKVPVETGSIRLAGLSRLVGWTSGNVRSFGSGTSVDFRRILKTVEGNARTIVHLSSFDEFRREGKFDEMDWLSREVERELLQPVLEMDRESSWAILSPGQWGLGLVSTLATDVRNDLPFDERAFESSGLFQKPLHELVSESMSKFGRKS